VLQMSSQEELSRSNQEDVISALVSCTLRPAMTRSYSVLAPALSPNAILDLSIPVSSGTSKKKELSEVCVVRHYDLKSYVRDEEEQAPLGAIKRIAVGQSQGESSDDQIVSSAPFPESFRN
jgi:hypothetical protein